MNIELYIDRQLCDTGNPRDLGIVLKRVFIKPSELNTKDAQKSYDITLPATTRNNAIFAHTNIEEVQGKFTAYPDAQLYIDGVKIFDGKFRLSAITRTHYRGNLGVPAPLTVKDIFGETNMNQAGRWLIPFNGIPDLAYYNAPDYQDIRSEEDEYNYGSIPPCIFPLVLYKLLQKESQYGSYSPKNVIDNSVRFRLNDFPPSINCIHMLRKVFENSGYTLTGSALEDERLKNLYVSYKNPNEHEMQWGIGEIKIHGEWSNYINGVREWLRGNTGLGESFAFINLNLMEAPKAKIRIDKDSGANVVTEGYRNILTVPTTGFYKLKFDARLTLLNNITGGDNEGIYIGPATLRDSSFELKVLRNVANTDLIPELHLDNVFLRNNINQTSDTPNKTYPTEGNVNFIDPYQNSKYICGFSWGNVPSNTPNREKYNNPLDTKSIKANPMAISGGKSWTIENRNDDIEKIDYRALSAVYSPGYNDRRFNVELFDSANQPAKCEVKIIDEKNADGEIHQVIWLEKGETLSVVITGSLLKWSGWCWANQLIDFNLSIQPFTDDTNWITVQNNGSSIKAMNWNDPSTFPQDEIDLVSFMPSGVKVNDWIDNFCKAFNLSLANTGANSFQLDVKNRNIVSQTSSIIDLDRKSSVRQCENEPLRLPYIYDLGFTVDTGEEGYYSSQADKSNINSGKDGGGKFYTGSHETSKAEQKSSFSYCWYKTLRDKTGDTEIALDVPVITDKEVAWDNLYNYNDTKDNAYYDKAQRFWYRKGIYSTQINNQRTITAAIVSGEFNKGNTRLVLDYGNEPDTIMRNYFLLLNNQKSYTVVEAYLTAEDYTALPYSLVCFNGNLYNIAEVDGYDPLAGKKAKLKLIPKIL